MEPIGRIVRLQVQRSSLKVVEGDEKRYDPAAILSVPALLLTEDGVVGLPEQIVDVHNRTHPHSKNREVNPVSIGFTSHYALMRRRFGPHLVDGIAGENILVEADGRVSLNELQGGLVVAGDAVLTDARVAEPCEPFTRWALLGVPGVKEGLQFLRDGMRGYYVRCEGGPAEVRLGDVIYARSRAPAG
jgi:hypothetical protein